MPVSSNDTSSVSIPSEEATDASPPLHTGPIRSLASAAKYITMIPCKWPSMILEDFLYLGDYESACNPLALKTLRVKHIINCTPDRIDLWEKRPLKRRKLDEQDKLSGTEGGESSDNAQSATMLSSSSNEISIERNEIEHHEGENDNIAHLLFPDVKIESYLRYANPRPISSLSQLS